MKAYAQTHLPFDLCLLPFAFGFPAPEDATHINPNAASIADEILIVSLDPHPGVEERCASLARGFEAILCPRDWPAQQVPRESSASAKIVRRRRLYFRARKRERHSLKSSLRHA